MKRFKQLSTACLLLSSAFLLEGYRENRQLEISHLTIKSNKLIIPNNSIKIAHLSDTQFPRLRVSIDKILTNLKKETPDLIFYTGDTIDRTETIESTQLPSFLQKLTKIAPTFIVNGNHEITHPNYEAWLKIINNSEAILLDNQFEEILIKQEKLNIIGLSEGQTNLDQKKKNQINPNLETLLLVHRPEKIDDYLKNFKQFSFTAFSGHAHGGQIILPFFGGILSPDQGFFPTYSNGLYQFDRNRLIVSRGLANSSFPSRINNYPHVIITTITNKKELDF